MLLNPAKHELKHELTNMISFIFLFFFFFLIIRVGTLKISFFKFQLFVHNGYLDTHNSFIHPWQLNTMDQLKPPLTHKVHFTFWALAFLIVISCWAMTDRTSMLILLNSSKQHQAPDCASPEKNPPIICSYRYTNKSVYLFPWDKGRYIKK